MQNQCDGADESGAERAVFRRACQEQCDEQQSWRSKCACME